MHVKLRTLKNGPTIRNRIQLPHPVNTSVRICVICPPDSPIANAAIRAGASVVGEETVFDAVKDGRIDFDRCICHIDSIQKLNKAGLGRILGPKGLLPSVKLGTVVKDVAGSVREMIGGSEYRERMGVVRMAVGQLGFTPEEMQRNIRAFLEKVKKDMAQMSDRINKELHEVVSLSPSPMSGKLRALYSLGTGLELHKCTRLQSKRRFQKSNFTANSRSVHPVIIYIAYLMSCLQYCSRYATSGTVSYMNQDAFAMLRCQHAAKRSSTVCLPGPSKHPSPRPFPDKCP